MKYILLKSKLHQAKVTEVNLEYEGSCGIDSQLLEAANIYPFEQVQIYNINNGERFITYAIIAPPGSRTIALYGAAAHKAKPGDRIIICTYGHYDSGEMAEHSPIVVQLTGENSIAHEND